MTGSNFQDALIVFDPALGPHVSQQAQVAFAQYYSRHINLRSGAHLGFVRNAFMFGHLRLTVHEY